MRRLFIFQLLTGTVIFILLMGIVTTDLLGTNSKEKDVNRCLICHVSPKPKVQVEGVEFKHSSYIKKKINCSFCHTNIVQGERKVSPDSCFTCHASEKYLEKIGETKYLHQIHITERKINCENCHQGITHPAGEKIIHWRQLEMEDSTYIGCSTCHGKQHLSSLLVYTGRAREDVKVQPSVMAKVNLTCQGCHQEEQIKKVDKKYVQIALASPEACDTCHGKGFGKVIISTWQKPVKEKYTKLNKRIQILQKKISKKEEAQKLLKKAKDILDLVQTDGSWGVHNPGYINLLLEKVENYLNEVEKL